MSQTKRKFLALVNNNDKTVILYSNSVANRRVVYKYLEVQKEKNIYDVYIVDAFKINEVVEKLSQELNIKLTRIKKPNKDIQNITNKCI